MDATIGPDDLARITGYSRKSEQQRCWSFLGPVVSTARWDSIEVSDVTQYLDRRTGKTRGNREVALLGILWNFALSRGLTKATNIVPHVTRNAESPDDRYVTDAELAAVKEHCPQFVTDYLDLAYLTGQRPSDTLRIRWADIRDGALHVRQSKTGKVSTQILLNQWLAFGRVKVIGPKAVQSTPVSSRRVKVDQADCGIPSATIPPRSAYERQAD